MLISALAILLFVEAYNIISVTIYAAMGTLFNYIQFAVDIAAIAANSILLINVTNSDVIKRGKRVKIIARIGSASATVDGILMEDGRPGEWVQVSRADDKRIKLRARIINENLVEVQVE